MPDTSKLSSYVKAGVNVQDGDIITFADAGEFIERDDNGKKRLALQIGVRLPSGETKIMSLNGTSVREMEELYGTKTENWVGKQACIQVVKQNVRGEVKNVAYLGIPEKEVS